ncbi:MAG: ATP-binding protein, partial [Pseudomonadota bacterium]
QEAQSMIGARTEADEDQTLRFEEDFPAEPIIVRGDRRLLRQAVLNLLTNAVKFCPQDPLVILRVQRSKTGEVAVCIEDNGIGIPPEMRDAVQQPFVQAERAETRTYGGVGLGLALVRQFAEAHDGRMSIDAGEEGGTVACILLPAARIVSRAKPAAEPVPAG